MEACSYDRRVGEHFRLDRAPTLNIRSRRRLKLAVTRLRSDEADHGEISPFPPDDGFAVILYLRDASSHRFWLNGRATIHCARSQGDVCVSSLEKPTSTYLETPFDWLVFQVPRMTLNEVASDAGARPIDALVPSNGVATADPVTARLGLCLLPAIEHPGQLNKLFIDHVASALCAHIVHAYGGMRLPAEAGAAGLAPWQERRATEIMTAHLDGDISVVEIAGECGLSRGHFDRAFKQSTGLSPHRWLVQRRLDKAKDLLRNSSLPIVEIALACGFAEQSHFTRVFTRNVGESPGIWRRQRIRA
jgi:AraC family transcriptional regulator